ncbi:hypothetical protein, partial [Burkholderia pseudomallei]
MRSSGRRSAGWAEPPPALPRRRAACAGSAPRPRRNAILPLDFIRRTSSVVLSFLLKLRTRAQTLFRLSDAHTMLVWSVIVGIGGALAT